MPTDCDRPHRLVPVRVALVVPIDPEHRGNGLAHRARFWRDALAPLGDLTVMVVPVAGPGPDLAPLNPGPRLADDIGRAIDAEASPGGGSSLRTCVVMPEPLFDATLPSLAQEAPLYLGERWSTEFDPFDLIVAFRSYLGPFCVGLRSVSGAKLIVDLDDDDEAFYADSGQLSEAECYRHLRAWLAARADLLVTATNELDNAEPSSTYAPTLVPNSVPLPESRRCSDDAPDSAQITMVGNFDFAPNADGLRWFEAAVLPRIVSEHPSARFVAVGPASDVVSSNGVGFVPDLTQLYAASAVVVAPIQRGSGTRIKALEAWAHELPIVATSRGLAGLASAGALVADEPASFAAAVCRLLDKPALAEELGSIGYKEVVARHSSTRVAEQALQLAHGLIVDRLEPLYVQAARLEVGELPDGLAIHQPDRGVVHQLNPTAAVLFSLLDQPHTESALVQALSELYGEGLVAPEAVAETLEDLAAKGVLWRSLVLAEGPSLT